MKRPLLREVRDVFGIPPAAVPARRLRSPRRAPARSATTWPDIDVVLGELRLGRTRLPRRAPRRQP
jgi:hypothetical protein